MGVQRALCGDISTHISCAGLIRVQLDFVPCGKSCIDLVCLS